MYKDRKTVIPEIGEADHADFAKLQTGFRTQMSRTSI